MSLHPRHLYDSKRVAKASASRLQVIHAGTYRDIIRPSLASPGCSRDFDTPHVVDREELQAWEEAERERDEAPP